MRFVAFGTRELVREVAFGLIVTHKRQITLDELRRASGVDDLDGIVDGLEQVGWIDRGRDGSVAGSAGLSMSDGPHSLQLRGTTFRTWCAYDALGIPAALREDAIIETTCGVCRKPIVVPISAGRPVRSGPELLWLAAGDGDLRTSFCSPTVLLCSAAHGERWAEQHEGASELLTLITGAERGAADWATSADAARRLDTQALDPIEVAYVGGAQDGKHQTVAETPAVLPLGDGEYRRSVRCADDGALRYVWSAGGEK